MIANKPTERQASDILAKKLYSQILELEDRIARMRLFMLQLMSGNAKVEVEDYKGHEWYLSASDSEGYGGVSVYEFVRKTKVVEEEVSRF